ncbi:MAG: hypothetical protein ABFR95_09055 [Actinomycetota bacterium]
MYTTRFAEFADDIAALPMKSSYTKADLLLDRFLLDQDAPIEVYYAPFDHLNTSARIVILGLTPGWTQMAASFAAARAAVEAGEPDDEVLRQAKRVAAFSGTMRTNLVAMLDALDVPNLFSLDSTASLFDSEYEDLVHASSALRYPVFNAGKNYSGYPTPDTWPVLLPYFTLLADELALTEKAFIIPLGKAVQGVLDILVSDGRIDPTRVVSGFPHPSGVNAHRVQIFEKNRTRMVDQIRDWNR